MSLLQRNDQAYPEYGDIVKLVKEVKEVNLACANPLSGCHGDANYSSPY
jgi:hypothetical protein